MSSLTEIPCRDVRFFSTKFNISRTASRRPPRCAPALDVGAEVRRACRAWEISSSAVRKWPDSSFLYDFFLFRCQMDRHLETPADHRLADRKIIHPQSGRRDSHPGFRPPGLRSRSPPLFVFSPLVTRHCFSFSRHSPLIFSSHVGLRVLHPPNRFRRAPLYPSTPCRSAGLALRHLRPFPVSASHGA